MKSSVKIIHSYCRVLFCLLLTTKHSVRPFKCLICFYRFLFLSRCVTAQYYLIQASFQFISTDQNFEITEENVICHSQNFFLFLRHAVIRLFRLRIAFESFRRFPNFCISRNSWADRRCLYRWRWSSNNFSIIGRLIGARMMLLLVKFVTITAKKYRCYEMFIELFVAFAVWGYAWGW